MTGISTFLADRIESLLPRTAVAACVPSSPWCSTIAVHKGNCWAYFHKDCHLSCHGRPVCGVEYPASCYGTVEVCSY